MPKKNEEITATAIEYAKRNKTQLVQTIADPSVYLSQDVNLAVFMAGSPGAGKTEYSKALIDDLEVRLGAKIVRIDGDEIRTYLPGYKGNNSSLFQGAISIVVSRILDVVVNKKQHFILDGTLSHHDRAAANIQRALDHGADVYILYIYQDPLVAWEFTKAREKVEGRNIPKAAFIQQFFDAYDTITLLHQEFGEKITIWLVKKNSLTNLVEDSILITPQDLTIDKYLDKTYTMATLKRNLK